MTIASCPGECCRDGLGPVAESATAAVLFGTGAPRAAVSAVTERAGSHVGTLGAGVALLRPDAAVCHAADLLVRGIGRRSGPLLSGGISS